MLNRRAFLYASIAATFSTPRETSAQQTGKTWRIGYLGGSPRAAPIDAFIEGLRALGYFDGQNAVIELKLANGRPERLPDLAAELVRLRPDVIVAAANIAGLAAKKATGTIPIVVVSSHDGVKAGLFASLARPGANVTGIESLAPDLDVKRLEFLKQVVPHLSQLSVLHNSTDPGALVHVDIARAAAQSLGCQVRLVEVRSTSELEPAFTAILRDRPDALLIVTDPLVFTHRARITEFAVQNRLPAIYEFRTFVEVGGLMSYGPNMLELWRRAAYYVDRILKGARPADLPVEQPTKIELVVNLRTATTLGLTMPPSLLARADDVIQ